MTNRPLNPRSDPFATLVSLTAAALSLTPIAPREPSPASRKAPKPAGSLLERLDRWLWRSRQRELERALASSTDIVDVEARLRARERRLLQRYY